MNGFGTEWYQAGSLFIQASFLVAAVRSVAKILKAIRVGQERTDALLRLSLSGGAAEGAKLESHGTTPHLLAGWPTAMPTAAPIEVQSAPRQDRAASAWSGLVGWLRTPMTSSGAGSWRRVMRWLQSPAGT